MSECKSASAASKGSELARDSHQRVVWMNDALPDLRALRALGRRFDLILLSAVWMQVAPKGRERAFRILSELLGPSGLLVITLRLGGDAAENAARGFHDTSAEELIGYANRRAIALRSRTTRPDLRRPSLKWETLVFAMPDDGTGSLPLLRHVIVNDNKSSTYKLGLLRTLVRLAETAPGLIIERTDDYVDIPFGAVGLYWLKQYLPLVLHHRLPQRPSGPGGYGWAKEAFHRLGAVSPSDLRLGARFDADRAVILTRAINDACGNIEKMPVRYITSNWWSGGLHWGDGFVAPYAFVAETLRRIAFQLDPVKRDTDRCHIRRRIGSFRDLWYMPGLEYRMNRVRIALIGERAGGMGGDAVGVVLGDVAQILGGQFRRRHRVTTAGRAGLC